MVKKKVHKKHKKHKKPKSTEEGKLWGAMKRAWKGYKIARAQKNKKDMRKYGDAIVEIRKKLGLKREKPPGTTKPKMINGMIY